MGSMKGEYFLGLVKGLGFLVLFVWGAMGEAFRGWRNHGITELRNLGCAKRRSNGNTEIQNSKSRIDGNGTN